MLAAALELSVPAIVVWSDDGRRVATWNSNRVRCIMIHRPEVRNAVDRSTAEALREAFLHFDTDDTVDVAVLCGAGKDFCAGADLHSIGTGDFQKMNDVSRLGPMGPTGLTLQKPVIAAIQGHCVAGGLELACWADLRIAAESASFGVFCRKVGVPLIDGGTVRLPRLIGHSRAMDMILTGRPVSATEAHQFGLVNRLVDEGADLLSRAIDLGHSLAALPQRCLRSDLASAKAQWGLSEKEAMKEELFHYGLSTLKAPDFAAGASAFSTTRRNHDKSKL